MSRFLHLLRRFGARQDGVASVEFVIYLPLVLVVFMSTFESGLLMARSVMLERAVDISMRELRLGRITNPTHDTLRDHICDNAPIFTDCQNVLLLELRPVSTATWQPLGTDVTCVDRDEVIQPVTEFNPGVPNDMMIVRACTVFDPIFPGAGLGLKLTKDATGGYQLFASSAFVNEPT